MHILPMLLALITASCVLQVIEPGQSKEWWRVVVPVGCVDQLAFVQMDEKDFLGELAFVHKHYDYKDKQGCKTSVTISSDVDFKKDPITFMDTQEISCSTASDGSLVLNFPRDQDKKYPQVKFPCNTKEIAIARIPSFREIKKVLNELKPSESLKDNEEQANDSFWWRLSDMMYTGLVNLPVNIAANLGELFSDYYRTFRKPVLGGLAISRESSATI